LHLLQVTIKAADSSISRDARKDLVAGISQALPQHLQCLSGDRIYMWVQHSVSTEHVDFLASNEDLWLYAMYAYDCCMVSKQGYHARHQQHRQVTQQGRHSQHVIERI
jgi:hypothetical protein